MGVQRLSGILLVALCAVLISGCAPQPTSDATPVPTFTSDADAFAAAEATYRAYVDALNQVDLADPETFEAVYAWTTGDFNASEREGFSQMHADGWRVGGRSLVLRTQPATGDEGVELLACVDVSGITLENADGVSQVSPERPARYAMSVEFEFGSTETGLIVSDVTAVESSACV